MAESRRRGKRAPANTEPTEQLTLWPDTIPAHPLHEAEAHMRKFVNSRPRRSHWTDRRSA